MGIVKTVRQLLQRKRARDPEYSSKRIGTARRKISWLIRQAESQLEARLQPHRGLGMAANILLILFGFVLIYVGMVSFEQSFHYREDLLKLSVPTYIYINFYIPVFLMAIIVHSIAIVGFIGNQRQNFEWLQAYMYLSGGVIILTVLMMVITAVVVWALKSGTILVLKDIVLADYWASAHVKAVVDIWQRDHKCCGILEWRDWNENGYFTCTEGNPSLDMCNVPISCCVVEERRDDMPQPLTNVSAILDPSRKCNWNVLKLSDEAAMKIISTAPCSDSISSFFNSVLLYMLATTVGIVVIFVILSFSARELSRHIRDMAVWSRRVNNYLNEEDRKLNLKPMRRHSLHSVDSSSGDIATK